MTLMQTLIVIFTIILLGAVCEKRKMFSNTQIESFELFLFKIAIPCYLFTVTISYDLSSLIYGPYIHSYLLSFLMIGLIIFCYFKRNHTYANICIKILASGYVNAAIYALPVITFLLGNPESAVLGNLVQVIIIQPIFLIILSFLNHREKTIGQKLFTSISNPLVAMPMIGLWLNYFQLNPNVIITTVTKNLGASASSIALFTFGLTLGNIKMSQETLNKDLLFMVLAKNIFHPVIAYLIGNYVFHLNTYWLSSLVIATSAPTAYVIYLIAKQFYVDPHAIKIIIAISSIVSLISLILITWALN